MKKQVFNFLSLCAGMFVTIVQAQQAHTLQQNASETYLSSPSVTQKVESGVLKNACTGVPNPDMVLEITGDYFNSPFTPDESGYGTIDVYIKNPSGQNTVKRPLVFVEGLNFDEPNDVQPYKNGQLGWCGFWGADPDFPRLADMPALLNELLARGYSVMMVDLGSGTDFIEKNGMALAKFLEQLYAHQLIASGQQVADIQIEPAVLIGASMGGLIGRFAIGYLNEQGKSSNVRSYMSFDTPHLGAVVPASIQKLFYDMGNDGPPLLGAKFRDVALQFCRPAVRELLMFQLPDSRPGYERTLFGNIQRNEFVNRLNGMGWENNIFNAAIINGSRIGTQIGSSSAPLFSWHVPLNCAGTDVFKLDIKRPASPSDVAIEVEYFDEDFYSPQFPGQGYFTCFTGFTNEFHAMNYNDGNYFMHAYSAGGINPLFKTLDDETGDFLDGNPVLATEYEDGFAMVPVYSAIAEPAMTINTPLTIVNGVNHQLEPNPQLRTTKPFDLVFAPQDNEEHVTVHDLGNDFYDYTGRNARFVLNNVIGSENPFDRNGGILNTTFNLCRMENRMFGSCTIENGGAYLVNNSGMADFGSQTPAGYPSEYGAYSTQNPYFNDYVARSCDCDHVTIEVKNGGVYRIGDPVQNLKANVVFEKGSKLILRNGSVLEINNGSIVDITEHAEIIIESGAQIVMNNPNSKLIIRNHNQTLAIGNGAGVVSVRGVNGQQGGIVSIEGQSVLKSGAQLVVDKSTLIEWNTMMVEENADIDLLGNDAFLWFQSDNALLHLKENVGLHIQPDPAVYNGEHGRVIFGNNQYEVARIQGEPGSVLTIEGSNSYNAIVEVRGRKVIVEDGLQQLRLVNGSVLNNSIQSDPNLTNIGTLIVYSGLKADDVRFVGVSQGTQPQDGLHIIRNVMAGCQLNNCNFSGFRKGILGTSVYIRTNAILNNCHFENCKKAGEFVGMCNGQMMEGSISGCADGFTFQTISGLNVVNKFVMTGNGSGVAVKNLSEDSRLNMVGNTITQFTNGLHSTGRMLNPMLKCNRITGCEVGVLSPRLNMSADHMAGYNYIGENNVTNIELDLPDSPSWVMLNHGHNTLTMNQSPIGPIVPIECEDCELQSDGFFEPILANSKKSISGYVGSDIITSQLTIPAYSNNWLHQTTQYSNSRINDLQYPRDLELFGSNCTQAQGTNQGFGACLYSSAFGRVNILDPIPIVDETQQCSTLIAGGSGFLGPFIYFMADAPVVSYHNGSVMVDLNLSVLLNDIHQRYLDISTPKSLTKDDLLLLAELDILWNESPKTEQDKLLKDKVTELFYLLLEKAVENDQIVNPANEDERVDLSLLENKKQHVESLIDQTVAGGQVEKIRTGISRSTLSALGGNYQASSQVLRGIETYLENLDIKSGTAYSLNASQRSCLMDLLQQVINGTMPAEDVAFEMGACDRMSQSERYSSIAGTTNSEGNSNRVYPNPAGDYATLSVADGLIGGIMRVFAVDGRLVLEQRISSVNMSIQTESLSRGVYQILLIGDGVPAETLRLVVNN